MWPKLGYDPARSRRMCPPRYPAGVRGPRRVSDLYATAEGRAWWDVNGVQMDMEFDLQAGSYSRELWEKRTAPRAPDRRPTRFHRRGTRRDGRASGRARRTRTAKIRGMASHLVLTGLDALAARLRSLRDLDPTPVLEEWRAHPR